MSKEVTGSKSRLGGNIFLIEETLTDGSLVHNVTIENSEGKNLVTFYCTDDIHALHVYSAMANAYFEFN